MRPLPAPRPATPAQADSDEQVISLWLHGRSVHTQRAYASDVARFLCFVGRPLQRITLGDLQAFADSQEGKSPATRARRLNAVKSLLHFAHRIGYLAFDVAAPVRIPLSAGQARSQRILTEAEVQRMLALETTPRDQVLLRLLYAAALRVSEACGLRWGDLQERGEAGQITVRGKGGKIRVVLLSAGVWKALVSLRGEAGPEDPVFRSRKGGSLDPSQVLRIVRAAARRAGLQARVSPHWLRHAHASHALDRGAPLHLVQATLGHASVATTGLYLHARPSDSSARYLAV